MIKNLPAIQETVGSIRVGKKPWKRERLSTPVFLPGESIDRHSWWATVRENEREVTQSCPTLCHPMDCSPTSSSVHGIFQARALVAIDSLFLSKPVSAFMDNSDTSFLVSFRHLSPWSLLKYMFIESVMISNYLILCCPHLLLIPVLPRITVFSNGFSYQMAKILEYQHQSFQ